MRVASAGSPEAAEHGEASGGTGGRPPGRKQDVGRWPEATEHGEASGGTGGRPPGENRMWEGGPRPPNTVRLRGVRGVVPREEASCGKVAPRPPNTVRRRRESNPCTGLCRPLPKPLGHSAVGASCADG